MQQWVSRRGPDSRDGEPAAFPEEDRGGKGEGEKMKHLQRTLMIFVDEEKLESVLDCLGQ